MAFLKNALAAIGAVTVAGLAIHILTSEKTENALKSALKKCDECTKDDCEPACAGGCCGECECVSTMPSNKDCFAQKENAEKKDAELAKEEPVMEKSNIPSLDLKPNEVEQDGNK